jgi:hypothetical protein
MSISAAEANASANSLYSSWISNLKLLNQQGVHPSARFMCEYDLVDVQRSVQKLYDTSKDLLTAINVSKLEIILTRSVSETQTLLKAATGHHSLM